MALHGLAHAVLGMPDTRTATEFYGRLGLTGGTLGWLATRDGGDQLRLVERPVRGLVELGVAADDPDDLDRIRDNASSRGSAVIDDGDDLVMGEPIVGLRFRITPRPRVVPIAPEPVSYNAPGRVVRPTERAAAVLREGPVRVRRLGHVLYATPDIDVSSQFLQRVLGFRLTDRVPGVIEFLRCSEDHHNVGLISSPVPFFHHSSWQVDDIDEIGRGASGLLAHDPTCDLWGLGRHFLGSNFFWYFRDPAGNFAEYYADLDQIVDDDMWIAREWEPDKSLYAWGPPVPAQFLEPIDLDELAAASAGTRAG